MITFSLIEVRTEQEKDRLAHLMAYGTDPTKMAFREAQRSPSPPPPRELDRFDECMSKKKKPLFLFYLIFVVVQEVEERKQFLDQMTALGKRREYQQVITNEIADVCIFKKFFHSYFIFSFLENS